MKFPLINGHRYGWASIELDIDGAGHVHITEITYSHTLEPGVVRGTGPQVAGATRGEYSAEGSITFNKEGWDELVEKFGDGFFEKYFDITVNYAEDGQPVTTDRLVGCRFTSSEKGGSQGTDGLTVTAPLFVTYILENGKKPLNNLRL